MRNRSNMAIRCQERATERIQKIEGESEQLSIDDITGTIGRWLSEDTSLIPLTIITSLMSVYGEAAGIIASSALTEETA